MAGTVLELWSKMSQKAFSEVSLGQGQGPKAGHSELTFVPAVVSPLKQGKGEGALRSCQVDLQELRLSV